MVPGCLETNHSDAEKIYFLFRFLNVTHITYAPRVRRLLLNPHRNLPRFPQVRGRGQGSASNADLQRTRRVSARHLGGLLVAPDLAPRKRGAPCSQAVVRRIDVAETIGKQS